MLLLHSALNDSQQLAGDGDTKSASQASCSSNHGVVQSGGAPAQEETTRNVSKDNDSRPAFTSAKYDKPREKDNSCYNNLDKRSIPIQKSTSSSPDTSTLKSLPTSSTISSSTSTSASSTGFPAVGAVIAGRAGASEGRLASEEREDSLGVREGRPESEDSDEVGEGVMVDVVDV